MKKILKLIAISCVITFSLIGCGVKEKPNNLKEEINNSQGNIELEKNNNQSITEEKQEIIKVFSKIEEAFGLNKETILSDKEITEKFEFDENIQGIEKEIRSKETENTIDEVGLVKIQDNEQTEKVMQVFVKRYLSLQEKYANNEEMLKIINNPDNYILKQEGGYITFILSEDAQKIESELNVRTESHEEV